MRFALRKKVMHSVSTDSKDQEKFSCFMYSISVFLKDPICNTEVFLLLSFKPDIDLKASNILISPLNDFKKTSSASVASSAKSLLLIKFFIKYWYSFEIFIFSYSCSQQFDAYNNRLAGKGHPCRKPFLILKKSFICPELMTGLLALY